MNKKFLGKKGQGAMEYLMTYGWAILVVMIVGVVLWQLGIFNLGGTVSRTLTGFGAVKPAEWALTGAALGDSIILVNGAGTTINVTGVVFDPTSCGNVVTSSIVAIGDLYQITPACSGTVSATYRLKMTISYTQQIGTVTQSHTSVGTISGIWE